MKTSVIMLTCDIDTALAEMSLTAFHSINAAPEEKEFIIVDNASPYGAGQIRGLPDIYVRNKVNKGYTGAVNQGAKLASGEFFCIANNDIKVSSNWIEVSQEIFKNPKIGSVHFKMVGYDEPMNLGNETWESGKEKWCSSSFFVVRREAFESVNGYDEGYKEGGYDDWDFWHRVRHVNGWLTAYTNKAGYQHRDSSTYIALDDGYNRTERDNRNREHFKSKFGEYAEDIWNKKYPEQMKAQWKPFP